MYWYILFVRTGRELKVEQFLRERLDSDIFNPFVPLQQFLFKTKGIVKKELKPLFPSYVFIESEIPGQEFIKRTKTLLCVSRDIVHILRYSDTEIAMRESEKQLLLSLCNDDRCIESSNGISEGNRIHILDGPLKGWESNVKKVNRHKRQAWVEIELMGSIRLVSVALEIVEKIKD
ncbi:antiterminator LoaP [Ruminiclostridium cellobioparum]|uniref:antiterminator LoaP n=1 Tax=Ruminiclostridium cellobioparum TaxID=29355 RepID=UPI00047FA5A2|nr:antiterminator LoaP [Ruminiclostridium cellobioparum]